jgi:outer membrane protein OmpA-like peptidoglycan-associated protein
MLLVTILGAPIASAGPKADILYHSPSPEQLADILFKPRYRSVVINEVAEKESLPNVFAMLINFEFDSTAVVHESTPLLNSVGRMMQLQQVANKSIIIEGHTDSTGSEPYNQLLSERRARAIKRYLVSRFAIQPSRLVVVGKGESQLYDEKNSVSAINRRVQFRPLGDAG